MSAHFFNFMKADWLEHFIVENGIYTSVESYSYLFPKIVDIGTVGDLIEKNHFPTISSLVPSILWCIFFCAFRFILEKSFFANLATLCLNIKVQGEPDEFKKLSNHTKTEISKIKKPTVSSTKVEASEASIKREALKEEYNKTLNDIASRNGLEVEIVRAYLKYFKKRQDDSKKITKFIEAFYRGLFYLIFTIIGYNVLFNCTDSDGEDSVCNSNGRVKWIDNLSLNWENYPYHRLIDPIRSYYLIQLGCYFHQLIWCEVTTSRSDALEMIVHHIATIILLTISYITNFTRFGSLILLTHDVADCFLEFAKCFNYIKQNNKAYESICGVLCDSLFGVFIIVFFVSRLVYYPFFILNAYFFTEGYCGYDFMGGKIFTVCLLLLQILHIYWFALIIVMVKKLLSPKGIVNDCRSDNGNDKEESIKSGDEINRSTSNENLQMNTSNLDQKKNN